MMEESGENTPKEEKNPFIKGTKPIGGITIVGINLLVLVFYTLLLKLTTRDASFILDAFILLVHVIYCLGMALGKRSWMWLLSAVLVLAIGFSTCVLIGGSVG
ncbi:hypothetical protein [Mucilaginibacter sp.]|uniref:hypothetical protein n=1 Tax=Mucilaginibacter sp. TaxID=1882438 RepID=UPI002628F0C6|nr:hypothetical protein [Mucilaginibacter sp.]MDB4918624.1 hypothetical protein [Mucilaginibacter sp.]